MPESPANTGEAPEEDDVKEGEDTPESEPEHSEEVTGGEPEDDQEGEVVAEGPLSNLGEQEREMLLQQYIHYGEVAIETANQRVQTNRFFGLILTSVLAGLFALAQSTLTATSGAVVLLTAAFGSIVCYFWIQSLQSYRRLNKARYAILNEIESVLPVRMYLDEWRYLKRSKPDPEVIDPRPESDPNHRSHTIVEQWFVRLLTTGYLTVGGYAAGFILTPTIVDAGISRPSQTAVGLAGSTIILVGLVVFYVARRGYARYSGRQ